MKAAGNRFLQSKLLILGAVLVSVAGLATFLMNREASLDLTAATVQRTAEPPWPALTAAEEQCIRKLWPIGAAGTFLVEGVAVNVKHSTL